MTLDSKKTFAVVCRHNMNRSVQAHFMMSLAGLNVESFGTVPRVFLPGPDPYSRKVLGFDYGTDYKEILQKLKNLNSSFYDKIGVINMLEENIRTKKSPQNICDTRFDYDVIISLDELSSDALLSKISSLRYQLSRSKDRLIHFVNFPIQDELNNIKNACHHVAVLASMINESRDHIIGDIVDEFNETAKLEGYTATYKKIELFKNDYVVKTNTNLRKRCANVVNTNLKRCRV